MSVKLGDPDWLWTIPAFLVALAVVTRTVQLRPKAARVGSRLRAGAAIMAVFALAQPQVGFGHDLSTVLALQRAPANDPSTVTIERRLVAAARRSGCSGPCALVTFGRDAQLLDDDRAATVGEPEDFGDANTNAGLQAAIALARPGGRVLLLANGWHGGATEAAVGAARAKHVKVDYVPLPASSAGDVAITRVSAPALVHTGDQIGLSVTVNSPAATQGRLTVAVDGRAAAVDSVRLHRGDTVFTSDYVAQPGWEAFTATIVVPGDTDAANETLSTVVVATGRPRALVVTSNPGSPVPALVSRLGFDVTRIAPTELPTDGAHLRRWNSVILDDIAADAIRASQVTALSRGVRLDGVGLVVFGGKDSFSRGAYAGTAFERLLPVASRSAQSDKPDQRALELVLDHSGSMIDLAGRVPKIEMVRTAAVAVARFVAAHGDELGIIDFDVVPHTLLALQTLHSGRRAGAIEHAITTLQASGGTDIYAALRDGYRDLRQARAPDKHMILLTDGVSEPQDYSQLLAEIRRSHITVATIALGSDADRALLRRIAAATGGQFYATDDAAELPTIFAREERFGVKPNAVAGPLDVAASADSPLIRAAIGQRLPPVLGTEITTPKVGAESVLDASIPGIGTVPILAAWQVGLGRVTVFPPGIGGSWGRNWLAEAGVWDDALRWTDSLAAPAGVPTVAAAGDGSAMVTVSVPHVHQAQGLDMIVASAAGPVTKVRLSEIEPGVYEGLVPDRASVVATFDLRETGHGRSVAAGLIALPYPAQDRPVAASAALDTIAIETGGARLDVARSLASLAQRWHSVSWIVVLVAALTWATAVTICSGTQRVRF